MVRKDIYIYNHQEQFLKAMKGNLSDHIRRAIDEYILKIARESVAHSKSKRGGK